MFYSKIIGTGSYVPEKILTNDDLSKMVDTNDEWITTRTGIKRRHISEKNQFSSDLAYESSMNALKSAAIKAKDLDLIIVATTTPDLILPAVAAKLQAKLKAENAAAFDVQAVCSGFVYALTIADAMIVSGKFKNILVVGTETLSKILNWKDRATCILFGDGSGAMVVQAKEKKDGEVDGFITSSIKIDGNYANILSTTSGACTPDIPNSIVMEGQEVFKLAVNKVSEVCQEVLKKAGFSVKDIDWFVPHQANLRIIDSLIKKLDLPKEKAIITIEEYANTSSASIPISFDKAVKEGKIKKGDIVLIAAMGAGFTWGAAVFKY